MPASAQISRKMTRKSLSQNRVENERRGGGVVQQLINLRFD
jgi:hypothetical protein